MTDLHGGTVGVDGCAALLDDTMRDLPCKRLELDETASAFESEPDVRAMYKALKITVEPLLVPRLI